MKYKLPSYIIIGAMKCGTSGLYHNLVQHPYIQPAKCKELRFWSNDSKFKQGMKYYKTFFNPCKNNQITGEASPSYILYEKVARRIELIKNHPFAEEFSNVKLIVMLRHPAERAFSQYKHYILNCKRFNRGSGDIDFETFLKVYNTASFKSNAFWMGKDVLERSIYINYLRFWFKYLPKEQFHIIKSEDYFKNTQEEVNKVFNFLKLDNHQVTIKNPNRSKNPLKLKKETKKNLNNFFIDYNNELYKLLNRDFGWENEV